MQKTVFVNTTILAMNVNFAKLVFFGCLNNAYISVIVYLAQQVCKIFHSFELNQHFNKHLFCRKISRFT